MEKAQNPVLDTDGHALVLYALALASRARVILELGVRDGNSTLPLLTAAHQNRGSLFSVDKNPVEFNARGMEDSWHFRQEDALTFLAEWPKDVKIDLVFIDDWHAYEHVKRELQLLDPLVGPSSLILIHDAMHASEPFYYTNGDIEGQWANGGPSRAVLELDRHFWEYATLPWSHGLTIVRKTHSLKYHAR